MDTHELRGADGGLVGYAHGPHRDGTYCLTMLNGHTLTAATSDLAEAVRILEVCEAALMNAETRELGLWIVNDEPMYRATHEMRTGRYAIDSAETLRIALEAFDLVPIVGIDAPILWDALHASLMNCND